VASTGSDVPARVDEIAGIAGSLPQGTFNRSLLRVAQEVSPYSLRFAEWMAIFSEREGGGEGPK
jgi:hypothetical protein